MARTADPDALVRLATEQGAALQEASGQKHSGLSHAVARFVALEREQSAESEDEKILQHFVPMRSWRGDTRSIQSAPSMRSLERPAKSVEVAGAGANQEMKLAKKLMSLIHLSEAERKVQEARGAVRMAEDSAEARAEGSAGPAGVEKVDTGSVKVLERQVLEAVLRELELTQQRRLEDPDGRNIWW